MPATATFMLRVGDDVFTPQIDDHGVFVCPNCGNDDMSVWADDGDADMADWFHCETWSGGCDTSGALVRSDDTKTTLNGITV